MGNRCDSERGPQQTVGSEPAQSCVPRGDRAESRAIGKQSGRDRMDVGHEGMRELRSDSELSGLGNWAGDNAKS